MWYTGCISHDYRFADYGFIPPWYFLHFQQTVSAMDEECTLESFTYISRYDTRMKMCAQGGYPVPSKNLMVRATVHAVASPELTMMATHYFRNN